MVQIVLIGIGAGAAAALLFASVTSGVILSVLLFYLAPLPIMIAALGWSHWAGLAAAVTASSCLGIAFGGLFFVAFLTGVAAPAWWLGYLALLGRPVLNGGGTDIEWYPVGRLVLWAAILAALVIMIALASLGGDEQGVRTSLRGALDGILRLQTGAGSTGPLRVPGIDDPDRLLDLLATALPPMAAVIATLTQAFNLWLAAQVVRLSGRLRRPWPDLTAMAFPAASAALLPIAVAGTFIPGLPGLFASLFAATLAVAFAIIGFAFVHAVTRPLSGRPVLLTGTYLLVGIVGWPALIMTLVGLFETVFRWRERSQKRGPPIVPET